MSIYFCTLRSKFQVSCLLETNDAINRLLQCSVQGGSGSEAASLIYWGIEHLYATIISGSNRTFRNDPFVQCDECCRLEFSEVRNHSPL